jgi:hypothetical protein
LKALEAFSFFLFLLFFVAFLNFYFGCPWWDSNPRSPPYESGALPLSYRGAKSAKKLGFKILKIFQSLKRQS